MRCFSWLVGSLLALTVVVAMDANEGLTSLAHELENMHLYSMAEPVESSSRRPSTSLNSAAVPYEPNQALGKGPAAAHPDPSVGAMIQAHIQEATQILNRLKKWNSNILPPRALEKINEMLTITATNKPVVWLRKPSEWMRDKMPELIMKRAPLVKDFDNLFTQLAKYWALKPGPTNDHDGLKQLFQGMGHDDLRQVYRVAEDLEALALLWNRKSKLFWPTDATVGPFLDKTFSDHNDAHLVAFSRAIRDEIGGKFDIVPRIDTLQQANFVPSHWARDTSLVQGFQKRIEDLWTLYFSREFKDHRISQDDGVAHSKLAERRKFLMDRQEFILNTLGSAGRKTDYAQFEKLLQRMNNLGTGSGAEAPQAIDQTAAHFALGPPAQHGQAPPEGWVTMQGYAQPGVDGTGQGMWNVHVQHAAVVPNPHQQYGPPYAFVQPQPGGYPRGYPGGYPGEAPPGPLQAPYRGQFYGRWDGHGHGY